MHLNVSYTLAMYFVYGGWSCMVLNHYFIITVLGVCIYNLTCEHKLIMSMAYCRYVHQQCDGA